MITPNEINNRFNEKPTIFIGRNTKYYDFKW